MYAENISHTPAHGELGFPDKYKSSEYGNAETSSLSVAETSCQKEPDLTITLAVSGVLSAAVLIGMAGAAMLLCV